MNSLPENAHDALLQFLYQAPIGLLQTTLDGEITMINPMSAQLLMPLVPDGDLANLFDVLEPVAPGLRELAATTETVDGVICDGLRIQLPVPHASGGAATASRGEAPRQTIAIRLLKLGPKMLVASVTDVTLVVEREQQRLQRTKHDASRIDALSGLPNRSVVIERIAAALAARASDARRFAVLCVNCDRFDRVNVTLGTAVGDELLRLIGGRLNGTVRPEDATDERRPHEPSAARLGSDEFVLVLRNLRESDHGEGVARRVVDALAQPYVIGEHLIHVTASVGVVLSDHAAGGPDEVLQCANIAMHDAKRDGGARCSFFHPSMKERAARLGSVESELRTALAERQLFVVYQPIVALGGGRGEGRGEGRSEGRSEGRGEGDCTGVEALVRWRHPVRGIVPPIEFIEVAEQSGLIGALGDFVLNESCAQMRRWQRELGAAAPALVSVNLSKAQLRDGDFPARVRLALAASGLPASRLQLEVTESLAAQDATLQAQLHELKALGLTLALDDFGTGYSSLSSLHELPVDVVKIDRSFVSRLESSAHHRVLVEATVMVAKSLGMGTVAEGIETEGQAAALTRLGCDKAQGYWFAKPLTAPDVAAWLAVRAERHAALPVA